ncbi:efflux RND transporter periplasmic adaptor subunit [Thioclava sp. GXIMD4215]|uniref:efflux RND transporter periplasmic adaptor subunit n=1 Tax=Thioclava sp. GXIMD4215 TaxID=3131928 RepID=UPI00311B391B
MAVLALGTAQAWPALAQDAPSVQSPARVSGFARLRPQDGVRYLTGPAGDTTYRISKVLVHEGEMVTAGQPLLELDTGGPLSATVALAEAGVTEAEVSVNFAQIDIERKSRLRKSSVSPISQSDYDTALQTLELAKAQLVTAQKQLDYDKILLEQSVIRAPTDGMILDLNKRMGEGVIAGEDLIEMGDVAHMEALAEIFETKARFVAVGQTARFESPALAHPVSGKVIRVLPKVTETTIYATDALENLEKRVVQVVIALDRPKDVLLLNGFQGTVLIETRGAAR